MILKNFYGYLREMSRIGMSSTTSTAGQELVISDYLKDIENSVNYLYRYTSQSYQGMSPTYENYIFQMKSPFYGLAMRLGTGTTTPSIVDYHLENDITSSFSSRANSITRDWIDGKGLVIGIVATGTNSSSDPITINEIGISKNMYFSSGNSSTSYPRVCTFLFTRDVLEEPITVQPGSNFRIDYNWIVN